MNQVPPIYRLRQQDLYTGARLTWENVLLLIAIFGVYSPLYTPALVADRLAEILAAKALPDEKQRKVLHRNARRALETTIFQSVKKTWKKLKRFITYSVAPTYLDIALDEAGYAYYDEVLNKNWDAIENFLTAIATYLTAHSAALIAAGLPATFATDFTALHTLFTTTHFTLLTTRQGAPDGTKDKILANNKIYTDWMAVCADGKIIFEGDPTNTAKFTLKDILTLVRGAGNAGAQGHITLTHPSPTPPTPLIGVTLFIPETGDFTTTNSDGYYRIKGLPADDYTLIATYTPPGGLPPIIQSLPITIHTGTLSTFDFIF